MLILMGTDHQTYDEMRNKHFTPIVWASNDLQTVAHYYSGCIVELDIGIDPNQRLPFVSNMKELEQVIKDNHKKEYTYGKERVQYPVGAVWWSFSSKYLEQNLHSIREVQIDLREYFEQE